MNTPNKKTKLLYFPAVVSLIAGLMIYIIFRENTYISKIFENYIDFSYLRHCARAWESNFLKYYFPDFLWALSLDCWMHIIVSPKNRGSLACSAVSGGFGTFYEVLQYTDVVAGTFDFLDIAMYLSATALVSVYYYTLINQKKEKMK